MPCNEAKTRYSPQANKKAPWDRRCQLAWLASDSGHEHGDESQQKNQNAPAYGKHNGHQRHDSFDSVLFFGVAVVYDRQKVTLKRESDFNH